MARKPTARSLIPRAKSAPLNGVDFDLTKLSPRMMMKLTEVGNAVQDANLEQGKGGFTFTGIEGSMIKGVAEVVAMITIKKGPEYNLDWVLDVDDFEDMFAFFITAVGANSPDNEGGGDPN